jgi:hypothetical protein
MNKLSIQNKNYEYPFHTMHENKLYIKNPNNNSTKISYKKENGNYLLYLNNEK